MAKGYWVGRVDISDPEKYNAYKQGSAAVLRKFGGHFLARGGESEAVEGQGRSRTVIIEFKDYAAALACYRSPEYARAKALRENAGVGDLVVVEGYDGPQPADS